MAKFALPALFRRSKNVLTPEQLKQIHTLFYPALTAQLSAQVWGNGMPNAPVYPDWTTNSAAKSYTTIDQVYSVVNKVAETTSLIPFYVYYQKNEKQARKYATLTNRLFYTNKGLFDILLLQAKALDEAPETDPLTKLLAHPNEHQSQQNFFLENYCYYLLNGETFIYKYRPNGGGNMGKVTELHVLPPCHVILHVSKDYPQKVTGYDYVMNGSPIFRNIPPGDIIHIKRFNPETDFSYSWNYTKFRGLSPLIPAQKLLTRLNSADNASVTQLQNGGVPGIVYDETVGNEEISQEVLDKMKKHFLDYIRNPDNKGAPWFTAGKKQYVSLGLKLADMAVTELQNMDFKRLCNIYKISTILFNSEVAATESNVKEMIKQMYTNVCLPLAFTFRDKFNSELINESFGDGRRRFVDCDISGITELQDDYKDLANVLATLPITPTGNEMRELFKWDRIDNELMDVPLVKQGYNVIDDLSFPAPQG